MLSCSVNLTDEQIENDYDGQLQKTMEMPLCNLIAKVFKVLTKKSVSECFKQSSCVCINLIDTISSISC